jgi:molybdenum cofactor cytidylyltransferase
MGTDKALLRWPPATHGQSGVGTFLSAAIESLAPFSDVVIVVAGKNAPALTPIVYASGASLTINREPERGQFSSLQVGLQEVLNRGRDAAMVTLVDRPPVATSTLRTLTEAFELAISRWKWAVVPQIDGRHGHPIILGREMIEAFLKAPATAVARDIEHQNQTHIEYVAVDDRSVIVNVNTPEDYASLTVGAAR